MSDGVGSNDVLAVVGSMLTGESVVTGTEPAGSRDGLNVGGVVGSLVVGTPVVDMEGLGVGCTVGSLLGIPTDKREGLNVGRDDGGKVG